MKKSFNLILLGLLLISSKTFAQPITHPVAYGAGSGVYLDNWYKNYVRMRLDVVTPAAIAGEKEFSRANDGSGATSAWGGLVTTPLLNKTVVMPQAGDSLATVPITTSMAGKVALVYRGVNEFADKALAAQTAGAIACIVVNNRYGGPVFPGPGVVAASVTIPVFMISKADGDALDLQYLAGTPITVTLTPWGRSNNNDLGFVPQGIAGWSNFATPANQLNAGSSRNPMRLVDGAFIANYGLHNATNVKISDTLTYTPTGGSPSVVNTGITPNLTAFPPADSIYAMFDATAFNFPATASGNGRFDLKYTILSDSADLYARDNKATYSFYKTDSLYSKGKYDFANNVPFVGNFSGLLSGAFLWGPTYYVAHGGTCITSVQFSLTDVLTSIGPIGLGSVNVHAFKWVDGVGGTLDSFVENGELTEVSMGIYNFQPTDSLGGVFKVRMGDLSGTPAGILLDSNSWYYIAVEVPSGFLLGVDGQQSPYPRIYGRAFGTPSSVDYSNIMWPGDYFSFISSSATQAEEPCAFPSVFFVNSIDSFNYSNLRGLIPAVSMIVNNNPLSLISGPTGMCVGDFDTFTDPIPGGTWTSSNPSVATIVSATGNAHAIAAGTATITYTTSSSFATITVTVAPFPDAGAISGSSFVCEGSTTTLTESVTGGTWTIAGTSPTPPISVSGTGVVTGLLSSGFETVLYVVANACSIDVASHSISVGPAIVTGSVTGPSTVCVGGTVTFSNSASGGTWSTASGKASVSGGVVTGIAGGTDIVSYTITTFCGSAAATAPITINPLPVPVVITSGINLSTTIAYSSYQWLYAGGAIGGATSATYTATLDGAYAVTVTDANGCTGTSDLALVSTTGIDNVQGTVGIIIAPNPTSAAFTIQSNNAGTFTVYSIEGREIKRYSVAAGNTSLSLPESLAAGVYMCRFENENGAKTMVRLVYEPK